ncbi:MAG: DUF6655 family protein [Planctomycetota bacterium]
MKLRKLSAATILLCGIVMFTAGCGTVRVTDTPRTATEQLLVATAVEDAVSKLDFDLLEDRKVFLDASLVDRTDKSFIVAEVRAAGRESGVVFVDDRDQADYVMELRAGAAGTNRTDYMLGIPAGQVPTIGGTIGTPELPVYKSISQTGACHVAFVAYARDDGAFLYASGPAYGSSDHKSRWIMGAGPGVQTDMTPPSGASETGDEKTGPSESEHDGSNRQ